MKSHTIDRYEIKTELGRGGMATVFLAHDPRFQRDVALKILPPEFLHDPSFKARFQREATTIATLEHQAIVPVYDFGEENGLPFLVMRYLSGGSLADRLKEQRLTFDETVRIIDHIAPALDEAHQNGIVHRDLKPDNILFDQHSNPYLTDFGIVKLTEEGNTGFTTGGRIMGTPAYMSPEQANGEELDGRSDIYSLGVIVFQMLTGHLPFDAKTPIALIMEHMTKPVPEILEINPKLPRGCDQVIKKAMAKERADRFESVGALAKALGRAPKVRTSTLKRIKPVTGSLPRIKGNTGQLSIDEEILCPQCSSTNPATTRFCTTCSTRLQLDCVVCHTTNRIDATHCTKCGVNLKQTQARREAVQEARQSSLAERKKAYREKAAQQLKDRLKTLLADLDDRKSRPQAQKRLSRLSSEAIEMLTENLLSSNDPRARYDSAVVLEQLHQRAGLEEGLSHTILQAFVDALNDSNPRVRRQIQEALQRMDNNQSNIFNSFLDWLAGG